MRNSKIDGHAKKHQKYAVALVRSANPEQVQPSESFANQYSAIAAYAKNHGIEIQKTFESSTQSAKTILWEILSYCEANPDVTYLLVKDVDRLTRSFADYCSYKAVFAKYGVSICTATESNFSPDTPMGYFMETLTSAIGKLESSARSEITKAGMLRRAEQGYSVQQPPFGYSTTKTPGLFKVNFFGATLGEELKKLVKGKTTIESVAAKMGLSDPFASDPKPWSVSKIKHLASNPYYAGYISCQGHLHIGKHEPILTPKEQQQLIEMFGQ